MKKKRVKGKSNIVKYVSKYKRVIISMFVVLFFAVMLGRAVTFLNKFLVDKVLVSNDYGILIGIGSSIFGLLAIEAVMYFVQNVVFAKTGYQIAADIRRDLFSKIIYAPLEYHETNPVAMAMAKASTYVNDVGNFCYKNLIPFIINITKFFAIFLFMLALSPLLSLLVFGVLIIIVFGVLLVNKISSKRMEKYKVWELEREKIVVDSVFGLNEIMTNNGKSAQIKRFESAHNELNKTWLDFSKTNELLLPMIEVLWSIGVVVVCLLSYSLLGTGTIALGVVVSFLGYISQSTEPIQQVATNSKAFAGIISTFKKVFEVLDVNTTYISKRDKILNDERVDLTLKNVACEHKFKGRVLDNINLSVPFGTKVQVYGASGSGKTTLCYLIARFYSPCEGEILFNNVNSKNISNQSFVENVGILTGEVHLFDDTLYNNLLVAKPTATSADVKAVIERVGLKKKVDKLPNDIIHHIKKDGIVFSAGERQLIGLARLLLQDPKIVIIDEAVCSADEKTKEKVLEIINSWGNAKTCFYISTKKEKSLKADMTILMENGKIIE